MKRLLTTSAGLFLAALAMAAFTLSSATVRAEDYLYETNNGTIRITTYTGPGGAVIIPSTIHGFPVTAIGDHAFALCFNLTAVTIPSGITEIGDYAFAQCTELTAVTI